MTPDGPRADEDTALLAAYAAGETRAARLLTERLTPVAYRLALRMLGDRAEAEDVAQEALLRLWRAAPDWDPGRARISTWIYRVASNLCIDRLRRGRGSGWTRRLRRLIPRGAPRRPWWRATGRMRCNTPLRSFPTASARPWSCAISMNSPTPRSRRSWRRVSRRWRA